VYDHRWRLGVGFDGMDVRASRPRLQPSDLWWRVCDERPVSEWLSLCGRPGDLRMSGSQLPDAAECAALVRGDSEGKCEYGALWTIAGHLARIADSLESAPPLRVDTDGWFMTYGTGDISREEEG